MAAGGAFLHEHAFNKVGNGELPAGGRRTLGAASRGSRGVRLVRGGRGKMLGEKRSENLGQHEGVNDAALLCLENFLQGLLAETGGNLIAQNHFKAARLGYLTARAAETDLPAEPGDILITRLGFFRQQTGRFVQMRCARPANGAPVRKNLLTDRRRLMAADVEVEREDAEEKKQERGGKGKKTAAANRGGR
jgi:hypothetical protein